MQKTYEELVHEQLAREHEAEMEAQRQDKRESQPAYYTPFYPEDHRN